jgi:hypothetical protein
MGDERPKRLTAAMTVFSIRQGALALHKTATQRAGFIPLPCRPLMLIIACSATLPPPPPPTSPLSPTRPQTLCHDLSYSVTMEFLGLLLLTAGALGSVLLWRFITAQANTPPTTLLGKGGAANDAADIELAPTSTVGGGAPRVA